MAVAAASILARVTFLRELGKLSKTYDMEILKGAGPEVDRNAIAFVKAFGWNELSKVAKLKFANTERIKNILLTTPYQNLNRGISMMQNKIVSEKTRFFFFNIQLIPIIDSLILLFFRQILEEVQNQIPYIHPF